MSSEPPLRRSEVVRTALRSTALSIGVNGTLAAIKIVAGLLGHSYALIADGIESLFDVVSSGVVYFGVRMAGVPATEKHPYGKGRFEALAAVVVSLALLVAAIGIAIGSIQEIVRPHLTPAPFTLIVLVVVIVVKELLYRSVISIGEQTSSVAVQTDAWHHRSDAITSLAALVGISIALLGGSGYESADDWAALIASGVIAFNGISLLRSALGELTDKAVEDDFIERIRAIAAQIEGVKGTHRCFVRKVGFDLYVELDVLVEGEISVRAGHDIAHAAHDRIRETLPMVRRVLVHVEPNDEYGRHRMEWE